MKALALALALVLHLSGGWSHLNADGRTNLSHLAVGPTTAVPATAPSLVLPPALPISIDQQPLQLQAAAAYAVDADSMTPLYSSHSDDKRPIASITKVATVLTILSRHQPNERVTIGQLPSYTTDDETVGLVTGDSTTVGDLIRMALIQSANDAADALALYDSGSVTKFAARMNLQMANWGITGAHFASASGLQDTNNYATAAGLARLGKLALSSDLIRQTVIEQTATITTGQGRTYNLHTIDQLLATGDFYGIKTGYTLAAGQCFLGLTRLDGHEVITVVLGSNDRFGDTQILVNWIGHNWQWL